MSTEFSNTYQDILLDNLVSIIKQNFVFQTQLKIAENIGQQKVELENQVKILQEQNSSFKQQEEQLNLYKNKLQQVVVDHEEKTRIQAALNEEMKNSLLYKEEIEKKNASIIKLSNEMKVMLDEIEKLKELVPASKLKKLEKPKPVEVKKEEPKIQKFIKPVDIKPKTLKIESGGTF